MRRLLFVFLALLAALPGRAIETSGSYDTTPPTSANIANWSTGWPVGNVTGWNYVGQVNGASGVYVGNGWVLTAGHVGEGNFTLGGMTYTAIPNSSRSISNASGTADLILFLIAAPPDLPVLPISTALPIAFTAKVTGSPVVLLGYGGIGSLSWGLDTVTEINESITPEGFTYISSDFFADNGTINRGLSSVTNNSNVVDGDSGGGDFIYNAATARWELAGVNEVTGAYSDYSGSYDGNGTFSGMVQLNVYAAQITAIVNPPPTDTPTLPLPASFALALLLCVAASRRERCNLAKSTALAIWTIWTIEIANLATLP